MEALYRAMAEVDRAADVMADEGLAWEWLVPSFGYMRTDGAFHFKSIPKTGELAPFFQELEKDEGSIFAGMLWKLRDNEASKTLVWITPFSSNEQANALLLLKASEAVQGAKKMGLGDVLKAH